MLVKNTLMALMGLAVAAEATSIHHPASGLSRRQNRGGNKGNQGGNQAGGNAGNAGSTTLNANAIQTGSQSTGQQNGVAADGQVNSATDNANFINFCSGKTLTNGLQQTGGSCNGIVMGDIPASTKMVSTVILNPKNLDTVTPNQSFNITVKIANMQLGAFTNATSTYYSAPQALNGQGQVIGHTHVTVQDVGNSLNPTEPLDAQKFVFFKGINDAGNGAGTLTTAVTGGLPAGNYRVCTISGASNHQPVLMPVAQRGAQEDCRYFSVANGGGGNAAGGTNNAAAGGNAAGGQGQGKGKGAGAAQGAGAAASSSAAAATSSQATGGRGGARGGKGNAGANAGAAATSAAAAASDVASSSAAAAASTTAAAGGQAGGRGGKGRGGNAGANNAGAAATSAAAAASDVASSSAAAAATTAAAAGGRGGKGRGGNAGANNAGAAAASSAAPAATTAAATGNAAGGRAGKGGKGGAAAAAAAGATNNNAVVAGAIAGVAAPVVADSGDATRPFSVNGDTFVNKAAAVQRACAIQNNGCANAVNSGAAQGVTVSDCNAQETACNAAA